MVVNFIREVSPKGPNHAGLGMIVPCLAILSNSDFFWQSSDENDYMVYFHWIFLFQVQHYSGNQFIGSLIFRYCKEIKWFQPIRASLHLQGLSSEDKVDVGGLFLVIWQGFLFGNVPPIGLQWFNPQNDWRCHQQKTTETSPSNSHWKKNASMRCSCFLMLIQHQGRHQSDFGRRTDLFLHLDHKNESGSDSNTQCSICVFCFTPLLRRIPSVPKMFVFFLHFGERIPHFTYMTVPRKQTEPTTNHLFEVRHT